MNGLTERLDAVTPAQIKQAYRHCAGIARQAAGNFYYAFLLLSGSKRRGIEALYAFCRAGDDAVDEPNPDERKRFLIDRLRRRLDLCYDGCFEDPLTLALADSIRRFGFDRKDFDDLFLGIESDLRNQQIDSYDDFELYCYRVASTVGLLCLKIFSADGEESRRYAVDLGIAMQTTNILRDVREDYERGRIYIPQQVLRSKNIERERLFDQANEFALREVIAELAGRASERFESASKVLPVEYKGKLIAARGMGAIYKKILNRIEVDPLPHKRIELTHSEKVLITKRLLLGEDL